MSSILNICLVLFGLLRYSSAAGYITGSACYERQSYYYTFYDYCINGCCGYTYSRYCCTSYDSYYYGYYYGYTYTDTSVSVGVIAGSIGGSVFFVIMLVTVICCICKSINKRSAHRGVVVAPALNGAMGVGIGNIPMQPQQYSQNHAHYPVNVPAGYPQPPANHPFVTEQSGNENMQVV